MNIKRIMSLLLCFIMIVPCTVFAEQSNEPVKYLASEGFSEVQGTNNWYYECRNSGTGAEFEQGATQTTDNTTVWCSNGGNTRGYISASTMLPGIEPSVAFDVMRKFSVPEDKLLVIGTNGAIRAKDVDLTNAFGVKIRITHNGETIYPTDAEWAELDSRDDVIKINELYVKAEANDEISFEARRTISGTAVEMRQNIIIWDPVIAEFSKPTARVSYNSNNDFSGVQGDSSWSYMYRNIDDGEFSEPVEFVYNSSWDTGRWCASEVYNNADYGFISKDKIHPGKLDSKTLSSIRAFKAPVGGRITITTADGIKSSLTSADFNAKIRILKNDDVIWPKDDNWEILESDAAESAFKEAVVDVKRDDMIMFEVCSNGDANAVNSILWVAQIDYEETEQYTAFEIDDEITETAEFGDNTWNNYSVKGTLNMNFSTDEFANIDFYKNDTNSYSLRVYSDKLVLYKNSTALATVSNSVENGKDCSFLIETEEVADGNMVSVYIDDEICLIAKESTYTAPAGKIAFGGSTDSFSFTDISLVTTIAKAEALAVEAAESAIHAFETEKNETNYNAAVDAIDVLEDGSVKNILSGVFGELLKDFKYISAVTSTEDRLVKVEGIDYSSRNGSISLTISNSDGYSGQISAIVDEKGIISGETILPETVKSGLITIKNSDETLICMVDYRKMSSECEIKSFMLDGVYGTISGNKITVNLTKATDVKAMIPVYVVSDYAKVYVNGAEQENGITENDFSKPVTYKVVAEDGTEKDYTVSVVPKKSQTSGLGGGGFGGGGGGVSSVKGDTVQNISVDHDLVKDEEKIQEYTDVLKDRWSYEYIQGLTGNKILSGNGNGAFEPERNITRAEFVKMLVLALNLENKGNAMEFSDVSPADWYYKYVQTAFSNGIVKGYDGYFGANENITREDMAVMICRSGTNIRQVKEADLFADFDTVSDYAKESIITLSKAEIMSGYGGRIMPKDNATREQAAKMIYLIMENI